MNIKLLNIIFILSHYLGYYNSVISSSEIYLTEENKLDIISKLIKGEIIKNPHDNMCYTLSPPIEKIKQKLPQYNVKNLENFMYEISDDNKDSTYTVKILNQFILKDFQSNNCASTINNGIIDYIIRIIKEIFKGADKFFEMWKSACSLMSFTKKINYNLTKFEISDDIKHILKIKYVKCIYNFQCLLSDTNSRINNILSHFKNDDTLRKIEFNYINTFLFECYMHTLTNDTILNSDKIAIKLGDSLDATYKKKEDCELDDSITFESLRSTFDRIKSPQGNKINESYYQYLFEIYKNIYEINNDFPLNTAISESELTEYFIDKDLCLLKNNSDKEIKIQAKSDVDRLFENRRFQKYTWKSICIRYKEYKKYQKKINTRYKNNNLNIDITSYITNLLKSGESLKNIRSRQNFNSINSGSIISNGNNDKILIKCKLLNIYNSIFLKNSVIQQNVIYQIFNLLTYDSNCKILPIKLELNQKLKSILENYEKNLDNKSYSANDIVNIYVGVYEKTNIKCDQTKLKSIVDLLLKQNVISTNQQYIDTSNFFKILENSYDFKQIYDIIHKWKYACCVLNMIKTIHSKNKENLLISDERKAILQTYTKSFVEGEKNKNTIKNLPSIIKLNDKKKQLARNLIDIIDAYEIFSDYDECVRLGKVILYFFKYDQVIEIDEINYLKKAVVRYFQTRKLQLNVNENRDIVNDYIEIFLFILNFNITNKIIIDHFNSIIYEIFITKNNCLVEKIILKIQALLFEQYDDVRKKINSKYDTFRHLLYIYEYLKNNVNESIDYNDSLKLLREYYLELLKSETSNSKVNVLESTFLNLNGIQKLYGTSLIKKLLIKCHYQRFIKYSIFNNLTMLFEYFKILVVEYPQDKNCNLLKLDTNKKLEINKKLVKVDKNYNSLEDDEKTHVYYLYASLITIINDDELWKYKLNKILFTSNKCEIKYVKRIYFIKNLYDKEFVSSYKSSVTSSSIWKGVCYSYKTVESYFDKTINLKLPKDIRIKFLIEYLNESIFNTNNKSLTKKGEVNKYEKIISKITQKSNNSKIYELLLRCESDNIINNPIFKINGSLIILIEILSFYYYPKNNDCIFEKFTVDEQKIFSDKIKTSDILKITDEINIAIIIDIFEVLYKISDNQISSKIIEKLTPELIIDKSACRIPSFNEEHFIIFVQNIMNNINDFLIINKLLALKLICMLRKQEQYFRNLSQLNNGYLIESIKSKIKNISISMSTNMNNKNAYNDTYQLLLKTIKDEKFFKSVQQNYIIGKLILCEIALLDKELDITQRLKIGIIFGIIFIFIILICIILVWIYKYKINKKFKIPPTK